MRAAPRDRLVSLDAFRGLAIAGMILVNNPGDWGAVYPPLRHADWHGCTFADLVFPAFLFILGVAIPFSFSRRLRASPTRSIHARIARRAAMLFGLGLLVNAFPWSWDPATLRLPGVLQRIAVCYAAAALLTLHTRPRTQSVVAATLLVGYAALIALAPAAGFGPGAIDSKDANLPALVDRLLLSGHLLGSTWDPEGILSTLPAIATTLLGVAAGDLLASARDERTKTVSLLGGGLLAIALGLAWSTVLPINKNLWTSSYAVFSAGIAATALAAFHAAIDLGGLARWFRSLVATGMNPIVCYVGSSLVGAALERCPLPLSARELTGKEWIFTRLAPHFARPENASLAYALGFVAGWMLIAEALYQRRLFVKL